MDLIRSAYTVGMTFSPTSGVVPVRWFFADKGAVYFGEPTAFYSRNWEDASEKFDALGEQPGNRRWDRGQRPALLTGKFFCPNDEDLFLGLPPGVTLERVVLAGPAPICCVDNAGAAGGGGNYPYQRATHWFMQGGAAGTGKNSWVRVPIMPALYKRTILTNPTPGATFSGNLTTQIWTIRINATLQADGGGGGGAKGGSSTSSAGAGGSSGGSFTGTQSGALGGILIPYVLGGGGAGGLAGNNPGQDGTADCQFNAPTPWTAPHGKGGQGMIAVPFLTGAVVVAGGHEVAGGVQGEPGLVVPGASGNTPISGRGGDSVTTGGGGQRVLSAGPGQDAEPISGSGGSGAVAASVDQPGGNGSTAFILVEEYNF